MSVIETARQFLQFAKGTRDDFHEPDEQDIHFIECCGSHLDNAFGVDANSREVIIRVKRGNAFYDFNLATLFALTKMGASGLLHNLKWAKSRHSHSR